MKHAFLAKLQSAGELPPGDLAALEGMCDDVRTFQPRRDIIREGDRPDHVHLMLEGWSCRYKLLEDGTRQITAFLVPGDFCDTHITMFAEMDHSIGTLTDSRVAFIDSKTMLAIAERPAVARAMWWASLVDEAVLRAWIVILGRREAIDRLAHLICELHARLRNVGLVSDDDEFQLPLTQEELADALGRTSVHVNRTLKRLHDAGLISFRRQQMVVSDIAGLRELANFDLNYLHLRPRTAARLSE